MDTKAREGQTCIESDLQEWVAYKLALGEGIKDIIDHLVSRAVSQEAAERFTREIINNPIFSAAARIAAEAKKLSAINDLVLDLERTADSRSQIPTEHDILPGAFFEKYYSANRPVVLKGIVEKWPAFHTWSLDFLRREFGAAVIQYQCRDLSKGHVEAFFNRPRTAPLSSYIDLIERDDMSARHLYLMSQDQLLRRIAFRRLLNDIDFSRNAIFDENGKSLNTDFWLGPKGAITPMHRDQNNIFLAQILGRKSVKLVSPLATHRIYNSRGHHSDIDFDTADLNKFPLARGLNVQEITISPGDMLFIPVSWWHHVTSVDLSLSISGTNFRRTNEFPQLSSYFQ